MPPPYVAGMRVRIVGAIHGQETNNVLNFGYNGTGLPDAQTLQDALINLATNVLECIQETLLPGITNNWTIRRVEAWQIYPTASDPIEVAATGTVTGSLSATSVSFASALVNIKTGVGGRRGRGKMFLPPPGEDEIAASNIDGPTLALITAFLACLAGKFIGGTKTTPYELGVLSRIDAGPTNANFDTGFRPAFSLQANPVVALMSSRKVGVGS